MASRCDASSEMVLFSGIVKLVESESVGGFFMKEFPFGKLSALRTPAFTGRVGIRPLPALVLLDAVKDALRLANA